MGAFDSILVALSDSLFIKIIQKNEWGINGGVKKYLIFFNLLQLASPKHKLYADAVYRFVVKKWESAIKFISCGKEAIAFMKFLMVTFGKPAKQRL